MTEIKVNSENFREIINNIRENFKVNFVSGLTGSEMIQMLISCLRDKKSNIVKALVKHVEQCPHHCCTQ